MSTAVSTHTGAGPLSLMSCVRESSPPQDIDTDYENEKNVGGGGQKKKRFWNKWFGKRKNKVSDDASSPNEVIEMPKESQRSRSTSELSETEEPTRRRTGTTMHPGLSVSHDSVFHSPHSGSEIELEGAQSSSSLSIHHTDRLQTELTERLRLRRGRGDTSEDDEGLPRSPCNSPTVTDTTTIKDNPKSHSTCSEASLLSVGSSEMDEDSFGQHSIHSSKLSLDDKNTADAYFDLDISLKNTSAPLNHSGARHKASVKPQRRYGAPRKKRLSSSILPTTPEVNEETAIRSITPDIASTKEIVTELYTSSTAISSSKTISKTSRIQTEKQLKCSSLPPGLAAPGSDSNKLNRSRSNAGSKYQEEFAALGEEDENKDNKKPDSFLGRIFPRRSGKKRKSKEEKIVSTSSSTLSTNTSVNAVSINTSKPAEAIHSSVKELIHTERRIETSFAKPMAIPRSGPAARQRIQPNDIPASPELNTRYEDSFKSSPDRNYPTSPLQVELENHFQQRLASLSTSPKGPSVMKTPPISPKLHRSPLISPPKSPLSYPKVPLKSHLVEKSTSKHSRSEEIRSKVIITGLSAFQQRAVNNNMDGNDMDGFKSLNDIPTEGIKASKLVAKSHSFKVTNNNSYGSSMENKTTFAALARSNEIQFGVTKTTNESNEFKSEIKKTISLDSIKNLDSVDTKNTNEIVENVKKKRLQDKEEIIEDRPVKTRRSNSKEDLQSPEPVMNIEAKEFTNKLKSTEHKTEDESSSKEFKEFSSKITHSESKEYTSKISPEIVEFPNNGITISGPRHKAVVSVINNESLSLISEMNTLTETNEIKQWETRKEIKEQQISVTKIQVKQESTQVASLSRNAVPEFMNIQLHKVEKPVNNVVLTAGFQIPKIDEQIQSFIADAPVDILAPNNQISNIRSCVEIEKPIEAELQTAENVRKFSKEDIEIIDKSDEDEKKHIVTALVTITTMTPPVPSRMFKKNDFQTRKSLVSVNTSEKPILKTKSSSLDMVESIKNNDDVKPEETNDIKAKAQSVNDLNETANEPNVPLRRKSMANKQKHEDEPELMKVFARRSLKLKDSESESLSQQVIKMMEESNAADVKSRDSDKENQMDSPSEERKRIGQKDLPKLKEPLLETTKFVEATTEVTLRKPANNNNNNKLYTYQRTVSLNNSKTNDINNERHNCDRIQKQNSFGDRPKTDHWINYKPVDGDPCNKICQEEILTSMAEKTLIEEEFCTKPKNFNQRKAEWEKRAQEASRKTTP